MTRTPLNTARSPLYPVGWNDAPADEVELCPHCDGHVDEDGHCADCNRDIDLEED